MLSRCLVYVLVNMLSTLDKPHVLGLVWYKYSHRTTVFFTLFWLDLTPS